MEVADVDDDDADAQLEHDAGDEQGNELPPTPRGGIPQRTARLSSPLGSRFYGV